MTEEWRDICGWEDYQISNLGRIRSKKREVRYKDGRTKWLEEMVLRTFQHYKTAYIQIRIYKNGRSQMKSIHRLVAEAFVPNPNNLKEINHKDGNKANNRADNLEWVTRRENLIHAYENGLRSDVIRCALINERGEREEFRSLISASQRLGRRNCYLSQCISRGRQASDNYGNRYTVEVI